MTSLSEHGATAVYCVRLYRRLRLLTITFQPACDQPYFVLPYKVLTVCLVTALTQWTAYTWVTVIQINIRLATVSTGERAACLLISCVYMYISKGPVQSFSLPTKLVIVLVLALTNCLTNCPYFHYMKSATDKSDFLILTKLRHLTGRDSSVGRALDWRSKGPRFDPGSRHFKE